MDRQRLGENLARRDGHGDRAHGPCYAPKPARPPHVLDATVTAIGHFFAGRYSDAALWAEKAVREQPSSHHLTGGSGKLRFGRTLRGRASGHCARASIRSRHARFQSPGSPHAIITINRPALRLRAIGTAAAARAVAADPGKARDTGLHLEHDSPMIHMRRGRRLEIAFVSYLEWAKLIATSLAISTVTTAIGVALWLWFLK